MFKKRVIVVRVLLLSLVLISIAGPVSLADSGDERKRLAGPDLAQAIMTLADLPESFEALTEQDLAESSELALSLATLLEEFTQAQVQYPAIFVYEDASQSVGAGGAGRCALQAGQRYPSARGVLGGPWRCDRH